MRCFWRMHSRTMRCFCRNAQQTIAGCGARACMRQCGCVAASRMLQNARACKCACAENTHYWFGVACAKHNRSHQALQRLTKFRCQVHNRTQACALLMRNNNIATRLCTQARVMRPTGMPSHYVFAKRCAHARQRITNRDVRVVLQSKHAKVHVPLKRCCKMRPPADAGERREPQPMRSAPKR